MDIGLEGELSKRAEPQVLVRKSVFDKYETYFERSSLQTARRQRFLRSSTSDC